MILGPTTPKHCRSPREKEGGEWRVVESKKQREKKKQRKTAAAGEETARKGSTVAPPVKGASSNPKQGRHALPKSQEEGTHPRVSWERKQGSTATAAAVDGREEAMEFD